jgi:arylsulfatase A-like enzyme
MHGCAVAIALAAGLGCGRAPDLVPTHDLIAEFPVAEIARERSVIDFGTDATRPLLIDGWSWDETRRDGTTFAWGTGKVSELEMFLAEPTQLRGTLRCFPFRFPGAPDQWVDVSVNEITIGRVNLKPGIHQYLLTFPPDVLLPGRNRVTLAYAYHRRPSDVRNSEDERDLAVGWDSIRFDGMEDPGEPSVEPDARELFVPFGTEIGFYLNLADRSRLRFARVTASGETGRLEIRWAVDGHRERQIAEIGPGDAPAEVALPRGFAGPTRLALRAVATDRGSDAGMKVGMPTVHGPARTVQEAVRNETVDAAECEQAVQPNVILYLVDTLRVDRLGCYGHGAPVSPNIDGLASEGVLFEHVVAQSSWTKPATVSILSGLGPLTHGINGRRDRLPESVTTLAELLHGHGYRTAAFASNAYITEKAGFAQGFDDFDFGHARSHTVTEKVVGWLDALPRSEPFFLYVHTIDPHAPYEPAQPYRDRFASAVTDPAVGTFDHLRAIGRKEVEATDALVADMLALYDAEVAENDHAFGVLIDRLRELDLYDETLIVFLSDHGEEFREHGVFGHGWDLYSEVVDVPMIVRPPGGLISRRVETTVQHIDVVPTVLEAVGAELPGWLEGTSLWPVMVGEGTDFEGRTAATYMDYEGREGIAISHDGWKLIEPLSEEFTPGPELYRREDDPEEQDNFAAEHEVRLEFLRSLGRRYLIDRTTAEPEDMPTFDHDTRRALEALGYLR